MNQIIRESGQGPRICLSEFHRNIWGVFCRYFVSKKLKKSLAFTEKVWYTLKAVA